MTDKGSIREQRGHGLDTGHFRRNEPERECLKFTFKKGSSTRELSRRRIKRHVLLGQCAGDQARPALQGQVGPEPLQPDQHPVAEAN